MMYETLGVQALMYETLGLQALMFETLGFQNLLQKVEPNCMRSFPIEPEGAGLFRFKQKSTRLFTYSQLPKGFPGA